MKDFISFTDHPLEELTELLDRADWLRTAWLEHRMPQSLRDHKVALWFYGNGFRNRVAFELGAKSMGALVSFIPGELGEYEPLEDIGGYLDNWFTMLVARVRRHENLLSVAKLSAIPVINARTDKGHPCEVLGDLQYVRRYRGTLDGLKVVFVGEATNLCMSWLEAASVFPIGVTQVCPKGYEVSQETMRRLSQNGAGRLAVTNDLGQALKSVDLIYTDCWPRARDYAEQSRIESEFLPYQITARHLSALGDKGLFLPCPPVTRGEEVSADAMKSSFCKNFEAKENLLHVQNAIMERLAKVER